MSDVLAADHHAASRPKAYRHGCNGTARLLSSDDRKDQLRGVFEASRALPELRPFLRLLGQPPILTNSPTPAQTAAISGGIKEGPMSQVKQNNTEEAPPNPQPTAID